MDFGYILFRIRKAFKKFFKKTKRFFKRWFRLLIKHTKAGDYSVLIYTVAVVLVFALLITLTVSLFKKTDKKSEKKNKTDVEITTTSSEGTATNTDGMLESDSDMKLKQEAKKIYKNNKELLVLANKQVALAEDYSFEKHTLNNGLVIDENCYIDLYRMLKACNDAGFHYNILSAYRTREEQQGIIDRNVQQFVDQGMNQDEAYEKTIETVQLVGHSEHETGLALDIVEEGEYSLYEELESNPTVKWFNENCVKYGFILRYPKGKDAITEISYEPWHFRYVGEDAAKFITKNKLTLEEFYDLLK